MFEAVTYLMGSPSLAVRTAFSKYLYPSLVARKRGVVAEGRIVVRGYPIIATCKGASIRLGDGVVLNSMNELYHINMHSPVKLLADRPGAEIVIGANTRINGTCIHAYERVTIGRNCLFGANTQVFDGNGHDLSFPDVENRINTTGGRQPIHIQDNVWVGANCLVLPGVTIGNGSVIAAGSVVTQDVPAFVVAGGNPARLIKEFPRP